MAKLKTFEDYIASLDSAEEIEKDVMSMGEPEEAGSGEEVITADQPDAEAPKKSDDEGAGVDAEEMEADSKEVYSEDDKETEEGDQDSPEDEGEEGAKEVTEAAKEDEDDDVDTQIADDEDEKESKEDEEKSEEGEKESKEKEEKEEKDSEEGEAQKNVEEMVKELYKRVKSEAKIWEDDMHDTHTIESYLKENAALVAMMAANTLKDCRDGITQEQYEAGCNGLKESYSKKIDEMMEAWDSEGEVM